MSTHQAQKDISSLKKKYIGFVSKPVTMEVEKGHIRAFAQAVEDPNPLWNDEAVARNTRLGGMVGSPTFLRAIRTERLQELPADFPFNRPLDGGSEWEYFEPVRPGDIITGVTKIVDIFDKTGRLGQMVFVVTETTYTNQLGQRVATQKNTSIRY
ncbi:MAG: MaoC family dehydratase [SAR202 cluster bacterium]|nr:MaoC family dehydratase [SAR202 cluster bacterium]